MPAAQATIGNDHGSLEVLDRPAKIDDRDPSLWGLKAKLHARLPEFVQARQSRRRTEEIRPVEGLTDEIVLVCAKCDTPVQEDATICKMRCRLRDRRIMDVRTAGAREHRPRSDSGEGSSRTRSESSRH